MQTTETEQDRASSLIVGELSSLLAEAFGGAGDGGGSAVVDVRPPLAVPIGGGGARSVIVFASSLDSPTRSCLESVLGRVLRRAAPAAGRPPGIPPSHVVLVSSHGTERAGRMPYLARNLLGGGILDKLGEMERGLIAASGGATSGGRRVPLDYTIVKFGDVEPGRDGRPGAGVSVRPGDASDGGIGPRAAAAVLLQATAYQPRARNSTLCAEGGMPPSGRIDAPTWNDEFLRLSGPELLRVEVGEAGTSDADLEELRRYVGFWSEAYDGGGGTTVPRGTGLTTPAIVRPSRRPPSSFDGVVDRSGVRVLFRTTNTGDRYKSAREERMDEWARGGGGTTASKDSSSSSPSSPARPTATSMAKERKEGGVEVLVERTAAGSVRVRACRCNVDDKTVVKEMSEEIIVGSLKKALGAWVDARGRSGR
jgi:hypothetical protein